MLTFFKAKAITNDQKHIIKDFTSLAIKKYQLQWYLTVLSHIKMTKIIQMIIPNVGEEQRKISTQTQLLRACMGTVERSIKIWME